MSTAVGRMTRASEGEGTLLLYGVFRSLVEHQVPLSVGDYLDAVRALEIQLRVDDVSTVTTRGSVRRLCEVLWTRGPEEVRLLHRIFDGIAPPTPQDIADIEARFQPEPRVRLPQPPESVASQAGLQQPPERDAAGPVADGLPAQLDAASVGVTFNPPGQAHGLPLPGRYWLPRVLPRGCCSPRL